MSYAAVLAREGVTTPLERMGFEEATARVLLIRAAHPLLVLRLLISNAGRPVSLDELHSGRETCSDWPNRARKAVERVRGPLADVGFPNLIITHIGQSSYSIFEWDASRWIRHVLDAARRMA